MFMNHAKAQWVLVVRLERAGAPGLTGLFRLVRMRLGDWETERLGDIFLVSSSRPKWRDLYCTMLISMHAVIGK